jgi:hypothetical protein
VQGVGGRCRWFIVPSYLFLKPNASRLLRSERRLVETMRASALESTHGVAFISLAIAMIFVIMLFAYRFLVLEEGEGYNAALAQRYRREA